MVRVAEWFGVTASELSSTLFPHYCLVCGERLSADRLMICPTCLDLLPRYPGSEALYEAEKRLEGHAPFMSTIREGALQIFRTAGGEPETLAIHGGFAEVNDRGLTVLAERAG